MSNFFPCISLALFDHRIATNLINVQVIYIFMVQWKYKWTAFLLPTIMGKTAKGLSLLQLILFFFYFITLLDSELVLFLSSYIDLTK